jgi:hypothetical protein
VGLRVWDITNIIRQGSLFSTDKISNSPDFALEQNFLFFDDMLVFDGFGHFGSTKGEVSDTS